MPAVTAGVPAPGIEGWRAPLVDETGGAQLYVEEMEGMRRSKDEVYATVRWEMDLDKGTTGGGVMNETVWMCEQMRAGQVYARRVFDSFEEAQSFQRRLLEVEPDTMFDVKQIEARQVWN